MHPTFTSAGRRRRAALRPLVPIGAVAAALSAVPIAGGFTFVPAGNGDRWGINDSAPPRVDTGSIRSTDSRSLTGFGGIRVMVDGVPAPRSNGWLMRGFGLQFDGYDRFTTTRTVDMNGLAITRSIRVGRDEPWIRWFDTFTNRAGRPLTVEVAFGGQTGIGVDDDSSEIVATASGDTAVTPDDAWVEVATPTSEAGAPSFNGPSAVVLGTAAPFSGAFRRTGNFLQDTFTEPRVDTGHFSNWHGYVYRLDLAPGETASLVHFVVTGRSESQDLLDTGSTPAAGEEVAAVRTLADRLAATPLLDDLGPAERCSIRNWDVAGIPGAAPAAGVCATLVALEPLPAPAFETTPVTASPYDVVGKTIQQMRADMEAGRTSSQQITRAYLDRIAAYDGGQFGFNAFQAVSATAMEQARIADEQRAAGERGPLLGIPIAIKNLYHTKDMVTTNGALVFQDFQPTQDATQVAKLREAGAVIIGKAAMEEYAQSGHYSNSAWGQVWNAFDPSRSALASSGGSGVATALSFAAAALGSQTGDSLYAPAAAASLYSLRGTDGMASVAGVMPLVWLQDYAGPMTRSVSDMADILNATTGTDPADPETADADRFRPQDWRSVLDADALKGARIGYFPAAFVDPFGTDGTVDASFAAVEQLRAAGAEVVEIAPEPAGPERGDMGDRLYESWRRWIEATPESPYTDAAEILTSPLKLPYTRRPAYTGPGAMTPEQVANWRTYREEYKRVIGEWLDAQEVDAVLYPALLSDISLNDGTRNAFGRDDTPSGSAGVPTVIMPAGVNDEGNPINVQLLGREWDDAKLVGYAYAFEQAGGGHVEPTTAPRLRYDPGAAPAPLTPGTPKTGPATPVPPNPTSGSAQASVSLRATYRVVKRGHRNRIVARARTTAALAGTTVLLQRRVRGGVVTMGRMRLTGTGRATITRTLSAKKGLRLRLSMAATPTTRRTATRFTRVRPVRAG